MGVDVTVVNDNVGIDGDVKGEIDDVDSDDVGADVDNVGDDVEVEHGTLPSLSGQIEIC